MKTGNALLSIFFIGMAHIFPLGLVFVSYSYELYDIFDPIPFVAPIFFIYMSVGALCAIAGVEKQTKKKNIDLQPVKNIPAEKKSKLAKKPIVRNQINISDLVDKTLKQNGKDIPVVTQEMKRESLKKQFFDGPVQPIEKPKKEPEVKPEEKTKEDPVTKEEPVQTVEPIPDAFMDSAFKSSYPDIPQLDLGINPLNKKDIAVIGQNVENFKKEQDIENLKKDIEDKKIKVEEIRKREQETSNKEN